MPVDEMADVLKGDRIHRTQMLRQASSQKSELGNGIRKMCLIYTVTWLDVVHCADTIK